MEAQVCQEKKKLDDDENKNTNTKSTFWLLAY